MIVTPHKTPKGKRIYKAVQIFRNKNNVITFIAESYGDTAHEAITKTLKKIIEL